MKEFIRLFLKEKNILFLIFLNTVIIFIQGFPNIPNSFLNYVEWMDAFITLCFFFELIIKLKFLGKEKFFSSWWNRLDFIWILLSLPSLVLVFIDETWVELDTLLIFRIFRVFKFIRLIRFVDGIEHLLVGLGRAFRSSIFVIIGFFIFLFVSSILSTQLFRELSPESFGDPLRSFYSMFKIFTIEGWYEIPEAMASKSSHGFAFFIKLYFSLFLLTGGVLGLSIVNSILVDAMVQDNTDELERKIDALSLELRELKEYVQKNLKQS